MTELLKFHLKNYGSLKFIVKSLFEIAQEQTSVDYEDWSLKNHISEKGIYEQYQAWPVKELKNDKEYFCTTRAEYREKLRNKNNYSNEQYGCDPDNPEDEYWVWNWEAIAKIADPIRKCELLMGIVGEYSQNMNQVWDLTEPAYVEYFKYHNSMSRYYQHRVNAIEEKKEMMLGYYEFDVEKYCALIAEEIRESNAWDDVKLNFEKFKNETVTDILNGSCEFEEDFHNDVDFVLKHLLKDEIFNDGLKKIHAELVFDKAKTEQKER